MAWIRVDDHFDEHPKLLKVGPLGWGYWLAGLAYCNRNLTDGFIPWGKARLLASFEVAEDDGCLWELSRTSGHSGQDITASWVIDLLVGAGLWDVVETDQGGIAGYQIHDYPEYQPLKTDVEKKREQTRERVAKWREKQDSNKEGNDVSNADGNAVTNGVSNAEVTQAVTPTPKPKPKEEEDSGTNVPADADAPPNAHYLLYEYICELNGSDPKDNPKPDKQLKVCGRLIESYGYELACDCAYDMAGDDFWRKKGFDAFNVEKQIDTGIEPDAEAFEFNVVDVDACHHW